MDINEAVLKLKKLEMIESQLMHLRAECANSSDIGYGKDCNEKAQELIRMLQLNSLFQ